VTRKLILIMAIALSCSLGNQGSLAQIPPSPFRETKPEGEIHPNPSPWRTATLLYTLRGHTTAVDSLVFSPDSRVLIQWRGLQ
jgi:hypothetical protein